MINSTPIQPGHGLTLGIGNGDEGKPPIRPEIRGNVGDIEPAVQSSKCRSPYAAAASEVQIIDVEMNEIVALRVIEYLLDHEQVKRQGVDTAAIGSKRPRTFRH